MDDKNYEECQLDENFRFTYKCSFLKQFEYMLWDWNISMRKETPIYLSWHYCPYCGVKIVPDGSDWAGNSRAGVHFIRTNRNKIFDKNHLKMKGE